MKKILLMGNPNVGKSVVFSRLTGVNVIQSNYPGTTVGYTKGHLKIGKNEMNIIDVPGTYSLSPSCKAEEVARDMFFDENPDLIINVLDATNLERNLYLTLQILEKNIPTVIVLNMWDAAKRKGIHLNLEKLQEIIGLKIIPAVAVTGEGIKDLVNIINEITLNKNIKLSKIPKMDDSEKWAFIGGILSEVQKIEHRHPSLLEKLEDASVKPFSGIIIAIIVLLVTMQVIIGIGEFLINYILDPLYYQYYGPFITSLVQNSIPTGFIHDILIGSGYEYETSFGLLTTGIYVIFAVVLPYILSFYFILGFLEDFGYLPRLAVLLDSIMHKLGLHGYATIPIILGFGCNVPAMLSTRILEGKREKFIATTLIAISIPCMAQTAVIIGLLGQYGIQYIIMVYGTLLILFITLGAILNFLLKGESPEIFFEIPPYRIPHMETLLKKTWMRVKGFLLEALPFVFLGILAINILYLIGVMGALSNLLSPIMSQMLGLPDQAIDALIMGFLRKDLATAMLAPLNLSPNQLVVACTVLATSFPCIATFIVLIKEIGIKDMLKTVVLMLSVALITGTILNIILNGLL
ncbi:ferrous iron transporter B [Methanobacterium petrolearium]|uniref:ferrous iron transporter B n=1 Tax=Methanobacterium petrolearium TaxID=710190 RepID=UPI001FD755D5|nr:ferrous iron transporter B [Methanobacterium petrolearium]MBP1945777.1 ferrous iron transport protein B [Methanobacterium petrolearium]BDZ69682.1 iron transporter FeoB [Methanobacterium petrolearium]